MTDGIIDYLLRGQLSLIWSHLVSSGLISRYVHRTGSPLLHHLSRNFLTHVIFTLVYVCVFVVYAITVKKIHYLCRLYSGVCVFIGCAITIKKISLLISSLLWWYMCVCVCTHVPKMTGSINTRGQNPYYQRVEVVMVWCESVVHRLG